MLPVANYLAGLTNLAQAASSGLSATASSGSIAAGIQTGLAALAGRGALQGSKPKALHTEYATGEANWEKPYASGTDIVFYMMRADKSGSPTSNKASDPYGSITFAEGSAVMGGESLSGEFGPEVFSNNGLMDGTSVFSSATQTGVNFADGVQSPLNQVATWNNTFDFPGFTQSNGLAGPLTGLDPGLVTKVGAVSQNAAFSSSAFASALNITQSVGSLESLRLSQASSEKFFTDLIGQSFSGGEAFVSTVRSAADIGNTFNNGSTAELASSLARVTGGITTATQLIEGINYGIIGVSSPSSSAQANRLGPQGLSRERIAK